MTVDLLRILRDAGWRVSQTPAPLPAAIHSRYPWLPAEVLSFLEGAREAINPSETAWLVTADATEPRIGFEWNAWELMSIQAAGSDTKWAEEIREFWNSHFPFANSVKDGYAYFAIKNVTGFPVVYGREPEFEEPEVVFSSFHEWQQGVVTTLSGEHSHFQIASAL